MRNRYLMGLALVAGMSWSIAAGGESRASQPGVPGMPSHADASPRVWAFRVALDEREIGTHVFRVREAQGRIDVVSEASFDVRLLGIPLYSYDHSANERWKDGCLESLTSRTNDNGTVHEVDGELRAEGFELLRGSGRALLPACTMTFAYWNPAFREQARLLNPQTGEYLDVSVAKIGRERIGVSTAEVDADRYTIRGDGIAIDLWYAVDDGRWLALDSESAGRRIRYRLDERIDATEAALPGQLSSY